MVGGNAFNFELPKVSLLTVTEGLGDGALCLTLHTSSPDNSYGPLQEKSLPLRGICLTKGEGSCTNSEKCKYPDIAKIQNLYCENFAQNTQEDILQKKLRLFDQQEKGGK